MYWVSTTDSSTYNFPEDSINGWLQVVKAENEIIVKQIFYRYGSKNSTGNYTYIRTSYDDGWSEWVKLVTNNDLGVRFNPIRINGEDGDTFSNHLKNIADNSVNFVVFLNVSDSPFSFPIGYAIVFNSRLIVESNIFTLIGFSRSADKEIEVKLLDFR